jgi:hypothetical protein
LTSGQHEIKTGDLVYGTMLTEEACTLLEEIDHRQTRANACAISLFVNLKKWRPADVIDGYKQHESIFQAAGNMPVYGRSIMDHEEAEGCFQVVEQEHRRGGKARLSSRVVEDLLRDRLPPAFSIPRLQGDAGHRLRRLLCHGMGGTGQAKHDQLADRVFFQKTEWAILATTVDAGL